MQDCMLQHVLLVTLSFPEPLGSDCAGHMIAVCSCDEMQSKVNAFSGLDKASRPSHAGVSIKGLSQLLYAMTAHLQSQLRGLNIRVLVNCRICL